MKEKTKKKLLKEIDRLEKTLKREKGGETFFMLYHEPLKKLRWTVKAFEGIEKNDR